ncbi:hypothetical protein JG687_00012811 [Phytophthora cactorum]|uniref:Uncharacterized protein n=1 Tax=Phytophthora cactorum TaxID=29920 RepID=A0A8T1U0S3_9STRA|nr:hypothetical protein JG687_00012811 [Phytophthora cactorum]
MGMTTGETKRQFHWYLEEYTGSPPKRNSLVHSYNWACSETVSMVANFLEKRALS